MKNVLYLSILVWISLSDVFSIDLRDGKWDAINSMYSKHSVSELMNIGNGSYHRKNYDTALVCYSIVCGHRNSSMDDNEFAVLARAYNRIAAIHYDYCNYSKSLESLFKALEICERIGDDYRFRIYNNIGTVYMAFSDFKSADKYFRAVYNLDKDKKDTKLTVYILNSLIIVNGNLLNYADVEQYTKEAKRFDLNEYSELNHTLLTGIGHLHLGNKSYDSAYYYFKKSLNVCGSESGDIARSCASLYDIANLYMELQKYDSAKYYLEMSIDIATKNNILDVQLNNYNKLSDLYTKLGNSNKSLFYKVKYYEVHASLFNANEYGKVKDASFLYEMDKVEREISHLNAERQLKDERIRVQKIILYIVVTVAIVLSLMLLIIYFQKRNLSQAYKTLFNTNIEIVNSDKLQKTLKEEYEKKITAVYAELDKAREELRDSKEKISQGAVNNITPEMPSETPKYQSSSLKKEQEVIVLEAIKDIMENGTDFLDFDFTLAKLAMMVNCNVKYVSQVINTSYSKSFNTFVNEHRIREARRLLSDPKYQNYTIESIATSVGFKSKSNFNPIFKKIVGLTPSEYQRMVRKANIA